MRFNIFRSRALNLGVGVSALVAIALLACFFLPLHRLRISTPPGSPERIAKVEKELQALQAEAAKDPARPSVAEIERQLQALQAEAAKDPARPTAAEIRRQLDSMARKRNGAGA